LLQNGFRLAPTKCSIAVQETTLLGRRISPEGISPDPNRIEALQSRTAPLTVTELRSFLGLAGTFRKFIKGYASICKPLTDLLRGSPAKNSQINLNDAELNAYETIKNLITSPPVLAYFKPKAP